MKRKEKQNKTRLKYSSLNLSHSRNVFLISIQRKQPNGKPKLILKEDLGREGEFDCQVIWIDLTHNVYFTLG